MSAPTLNDVIWQEAQALMALPQELDESLKHAADLLFKRPGRVITTGVGKSGHVARKVAATMSSTGTPSFYVHPTEASHGDLGSIVLGDSILMLSRSGRAVELVSIAERAAKLGLPVVLISENDKDSLATFATVILKLPKVKEAWGHAPTTSTIMQLAIGDAVAIELAHRNGFTDDDFREIHPGGVLGKKDPL